MNDLKVVDVLNHLLSLADNRIDLDNSVDRIILGSPETKVTGIAVGWMSYSWALRNAIDNGCNLFVTHEPTFYNHLDDQIQTYFQFQETKNKKKLIEENGLVILRCHDVWDLLPDIGIVDSWARFLGFDKILDSGKFIRVCDGEGKSAVEIARQVAGRTKILGQGTVQLLGPKDKVVNRVCIGTGAITPFEEYLDSYQADMGICTDDGFFQCFQGALAIDLDIPLLVVNHAVSEEPGIESLAKYLKDNYPDTKVHYIPQKCMYQEITTH